jgi:hypothetical protein
MLPLQMAPEIKDTGVPIDRRPMQLYDNLDSIASLELERREERPRLRIVQKLGEASAPPIRMVIDTFDSDIEIDAQSPPLRWLQEKANGPDGSLPRVGRNRRLKRSQSGS